MARTKDIKIQGMRGLNLDHPSLIADNEWADSQNCVQEADGLWGNRKGINTFDNDVGSNDKVHSLEAWKTDTGTRYLTVGSGTALYSYAESSAYNDGTFTSRKTGFTEDDKFEFAQYKDNMIATNGTESMYSTTDNSTWTQRNGANTRVAEYINFANDTGYCADVSGARSVVYYGSTVPTSPWEFANSIKTGEDDGQILTGLSNLGPVIIAAKTRSVYDVDIATPARNELDYSEGCVSHRSIIKALNSTYLASEEGITTLGQRAGTTGSLAAKAISEPVQNLWDKLTSKSDISGVYFPQTKSIYWSVQTSEQKYVLVYNIRFNSWSYFIGANALDWTVYEDSSGDYHLLYGDDADDKIRELLHEDRDDDEAPIHSVLTTKNYDFGIPSLKLVHYIIVEGYKSTGATVTCDIFFDDETIASRSEDITDTHFVSEAVSGGSLASGSLASAGLAGFVDAANDLEVRYFNIKIPLERSFRTVQFKLSNSGIGERWRFRSITANIEAESIDLYESANIS